MLRFSEKGFSLLNFILLAAFVVGAFNLYSYFNPHFSLSKYSVVALLDGYTDSVRKDDLKKIAAALDKYYMDHRSYPASDGWCGHIVSILHPEVKDAISPYFRDKAIPQDPKYPGTNKDYLYVRESADTFVLLSVLESDSEQTYKYDGCFDWPGDDVFKYRLVGTS